MIIKYTSIQLSKEFKKILGKEKEDKESYESYIKRIREHYNSNENRIIHRKRETE